VFDAGMGAYGRWFVGAETNTCHNCLDRHVAAGRGEQAAIIYDSPMTGEKRRFTYSEVLTEVTAIAAVSQGNPRRDQGATGSSFTCL